MELHKTYFITILLFIFNFKQALSRYHLFYTACDNTVGNYTGDSTYKSNLNTLFAKLENQASKAFFNNHTVGRDGVDEVTGLYLCRGDLDDEQCHNCVETATSTIAENCPVQKEAIVWYEECMVRYANQTITNRRELGPFSYWCSSTNSSDPEKFGKIVGETAIGLIDQAAYNTSRKGYATGEAYVSLFETAYIMAQCTPDILGSRCEGCLRVALSRMAGFFGTANVALSMYLPSCMLRYEDAPFLIGYVASEAEAEAEPPAFLSPVPQPPTEAIVLVNLVI
ncbi:hypothetical protein RND81_10G022000 [Saponaria officinalis]|uniref:Gnk2-homologous domain-containing protein n=1 Tax=Saponaria officinalis TaxID=3572 RepID=A0AAW1HY99_SAPOF